MFVSQLAAVHHVTIVQALQTSRLLSVPPVVLLVAGGDAAGGDAAGVGRAAGAGGSGTTLRGQNNRDEIA